MIQSLDRDELRRLLEVARAHSERNWLMILVAFAHGLRASEVVQIKADDIKDGFLTVARLKGSNRTTQPLIDGDSELFGERQAVVDLLKRLPGNQRLFPITRERFWQIFRKYAEAAGIPKHKRHPHVLKHTLATLSIRGSAKIDEVRQYLGHKNLSSTGAYLKVSDDDAAKAVQGSLKV